MATKRIKDLTSTATVADLISGRYGVLDTPDITKRLPGNLLGGGGGGDTGIVVFEVSYSESIADFVYPTYREVADVVSAGKMPVILRYEHNSPVRHCFVFRWLSAGYIHFDNDIQFVEISNVVETGYINDKNLAADYNPTATYGVDDYCVYQNVLYVCITDILVAEEFNLFHWRRTRMSDIARYAPMLSRTRTESDLVYETLTIEGGNSLTNLTLTTVQALTIRANSGVPNFAVEIDNTGNSNDVSVTVNNYEGTPLKASVAGGSVVGAGKYIQLTCVGSCWTLAEFGTANV